MSTDIDKSDNSFNSSKRHLGQEDQVLDYGYVLKQKRNPYKFIDETIIESKVKEPNGNLSVVFQGDTIQTITKSKQSRKQSRKYSEQESYAMGTFISGPKQFMILSISLIFLTKVFSIQIIEKQETQRFKLHLKEHFSYPLPNSEGATLTSFQQNSFCKINQQTIETETQQFTILQENEFKDYEFENDTPINFRQFIGMVHINDGMLAITSDSIAYMIKFNYDQVLQQSGFQLYGNGENFGGITWKADLRKILPSLTSKSELPQIVYSKTNNYAFVLFSDSAQFFSVEEMEKNQTSLQIFSVSNWKQREERWLTKEIDSYLFSAVGTHGMDIYKIDGQKVKFEMNVQLQNLQKSGNSLLLSDFSIVKIKDGRYQIYLLDENLGLILAYMYINSQGITFENIIDVQPIQGGIALDTKNGKNVFVAFQQDEQYFYVEYIVDFNNKSYQIATQKISNYRILDVDATDEFAIISGANHHQIVFSNSYDFLSSYKEKTYFTQIGMRDFDFFQYSYEKDQLSTIQEEDNYQYSDFFFGVTATNAFLTKFKFVPAKIVCFTNDKQQSNTKQFYSLQYNSTVIENGYVSTQKMIRTTLNFSIESLNTYLYSDQVEILSLLFTFLGVFLFLSIALIFYQFYQLKKESNKLDNEIIQVKTKATEISVNQKINQEDIPQQQQQQDQIP